MKSVSGQIKSFINFSMFVLLFLFSLVPGFVVSADENGGEEDQGVSSWDDYQPEETPCPGEKCSKDVDL